MNGSGGTATASRVSVHRYGSRELAPRTTRGYRLQSERRWVVEGPDHALTQIENQLPSANWTRAGTQTLILNLVRYWRFRVKTRSSMVHVRMDTELKRKATEALAAMGLTASQAVRLLFHRIAVDQAFPLELKVPNAETRAAMAEVDEMVSTRAARFASADEMFAELEEASDR